MPRTPSSHASRDASLLRKLALGMLVVSSAVPLALNLADPDLWGHVRYGQDWLAEGQLPRTATHTYTAEGHPWVNHENLAELAFAFGFPMLGNTGMLAAKCLLGLAILGLMHLAARRQGIDPIVTWALLLLVANNLQAFFPLRPQLLSFLLCGVMLFLLERAFDLSSLPRRVDWRWLAPLPVLMVVWVNSHGGFVAGLAILSAYLIGRSVEGFVHGDPARWRNTLAFGGLLTVCFAAVLVNPYGVGLASWLVESLGAARPEITEWAPPRPGNPVFWPLVALGVTAISSILFSTERRDWVKIAILALVGWQAAEHLRHIAFFALLCGFWLPAHVQSVVQRVGSQLRANLPTASLATWQKGVAVTALAAVIGLQSVALADRMSTLPVYRSHYPIEALHWMAEHTPEGKLVVCFNWAQYAIAALAPEMKVAFDGRFRTCYPQEIVDMSFDFLMGDLGPRNRSEHSGPIDGARVLEHGEPDYVLVDRRYVHAVGVMQKETQSDSPRWSLIYQDALAQLWGRASLVDDPASVRFMPQADRVVSDIAVGGAVEWPALPKVARDSNQTAAEGAIGDAAPDGRALYSTLGK